MSSFVSLLYHISVSLPAITHAFAYSSSYFTETLRIFFFYFHAFCLVFLFVGFFMSVITYLYENLNWKKHVKYLYAKLSKLAKRFTLLCFIRTYSIVIPNGEMLLRELFCHLTNYKIKS